MFERFANEGREAVRVASSEARRRGDAFIGTEHLLLGVLADPVGECASAVGLDLATARDALAWFDAHALAVYGIDAELAPSVRPASKWSRLPMTSGARSVFHHAIHEAVRLDEPKIEARHLLLGILAADATNAHDPAVMLLRFLARDLDEIRDRLLPVPAD